MTKILVIPDCQVKDGVDTAYLSHIGHYIVEKRPDQIVHLGDFADMPSLSSYDIGKKQFEGRRYTKDIEAARSGLVRLFRPLNELRAQQRRNAKRVYTPVKTILYGNHENRIVRAVDKDAKLEGLISLDNLGYRNHFDNVIPFLDVHIIEDIAFSHYFTTGTMGRPASTAQAQLNKKHMSCIAGHQQGLQFATAQRADGKRITSIIAGSCYTHEEDFLGGQGNQHWRGCLMLHEVNNGQFDLMPVSLDYLKGKYD